MEVEANGHIGHLAPPCGNTSKSGPFQGGQDLKNDSPLQEEFVFTDNYGRGHFLGEYKLQK